MSISKKLRYCSLIEFLEKFKLFFCSMLSIIIVNQKLETSDQQLSKRSSPVNRDIILALPFDTAFCMT